MRRARARAVVARNLLCLLYGGPERGHLLGLPFGFPFRRCLPHMTGGLGLLRRATQDAAPAVAPDDRLLFRHRLGVDRVGRIIRPGHDAQEGRKIRRDILQCWVKTKV